MSVLRGSRIASRDDRRPANPALTDGACAGLLWSTMTPLRALTILALSIPCGWLLAVLGFVLLVELEDTTFAFDAPYLSAKLQLHK